MDKNRKITYSCQDFHHPEDFTTLNKKPMTTKVKGLIRWHIANFGGNLSKAQTVLAVTEAMIEWQRVFDMIEPVGRHLDVKSTESFEEADIIIFSCPSKHDNLEVPYNEKKPYILRCPFDFDGVGGVLGHAWPIGQGLFGGHVHLDEAENPSATDIRTILFHEIGHALGFGHSEVKDAIMFSRYTGVKHKPHEDDIAVAGVVWSDYKYKVSGKRKKRKCWLF